MKNLTLLIMAALLLSCAGFQKKENADVLIPEKNDLVQEKAAGENELVKFSLYEGSHIAIIPLPNTWKVSMDLAHYLDVAGFFYMSKYNAGNVPAGILVQFVDNPYKQIEFEDYIIYDFACFMVQHDGFIIERMNWDISNNNDHRMVVYRIQNSSINFLQYAAYFDAGLHYYAKLALAINDESRLGEVIGDFRKCLEEAHFSGTGFKFL